VTPPEIEFARWVSAVVRELGLTPDGEVDGGAPRSVQVLEIAIDAVDIASIRPFWKAVLGDADEAGNVGLEDVLVDPVGQRPGDLVAADGRAAPQRNRIHLGISVPDDEAPIGSRPRWPRAARSCPTDGRQRSGFSPTPRATKPASRPGGAETTEARRMK
jgi:Glyoxalase-like domain